MLPHFGYQMNDKFYYILLVPCRTLDIKEKKIHDPVVDRTPLEPPPIIVAIVGPPKVGKTTLMRGLLKNYAAQKLSDIKGPVTVVSGRFPDCY